MTLPATFTTGGLVAPSPFLLAPMEGVSDAGFRRICAEAGAGLGYTEMVRARGVVRRNNSTLALIDTVDAEAPAGVQLLVVNEGELRATFEVLAELAQTTHPHFARIAAVDLNFGCPSKDVITIGAGPAMLKRRAKLRAIFEALADVKRRRVLPSVVSVSAKIRLGLNDAERAHKVYLPVVEMANDTLDHIVVHARHAKQRSRDRPDWSAIGEAKAHSKIPIVGNGDVSTRADALHMHEETGCDGVMVARAAVRDPCCFFALRGEVEPTAVEKLARAEAAFARFAPTRDKHRVFREELLERLRAQVAGRQVEVRIPDNAHLR
ncbi:MAG: hypothetical protein A2138_07735 [Deltaproteobacteria bacterium RBG_16_71_12]|nr:MAG: hypothetical protein A2138_07735 [Deltaproteobacteria bacterium RBG_16_71_12]